MPVNFLKNIIRQQETSVSDTRFLIRKPASKTCAACIEGFYIFHDIRSMKEHWIFNDGYPSVILFPDKGNTARITVDGKTEIFRSGWIDSGVIRKAYVEYPDDLDYVFIIRFTPGHFHKLFKLSPRFFRYRNILPLDNINFSHKLLEKIFAKQIVSEKIDLIESFIKNISPHKTHTGLLNSTISYINQNHGQVSVATVMHEFGVNYKWLERNFLNYLGITPKEYIQLQRFISAYITLDEKPCDLHATAISNGYYDYNHFLKEFKDFTGKTPVEYISANNI